MPALLSRLHLKKELFLVSLVFFVFCSVLLIGLMDIIIPLYICFDVFAGDGVALLHASKVLNMFKPKNTYQQIGVEILQNALEVFVFFFFLFP